MDFDDSADINFILGTGTDPDTITGTVRADSVALTTDTTGNYAAGDAEAGAALTGDSATAFFLSGTIEDARISGSAELDEVIGNTDFGDITTFSGGTVWTIDPDSVALTTDTTGNYAAGDAEAGAALTGTGSAFVGGNHCGCKNRW